MEIVQGKENVIAKSPKSPNVLKPKPLCFRKKPRRYAPLQPLSTLDSNVSDTAPKNVYLSKLPVVIPFKCTEKRKRDTDINDNINENSLLQHVVKNKNICSQKQMKNPISLSPPMVLNENANQDFNDQHFLSTSEKSTVLPLKKDKQLPVDWSLKTKARIVSEKPFPWTSRFKTSEEASGTTGFVRCLHSDDHKNSNCGLDSSYGAKLFQQCLVWMHPSLPWMDLFPRSDHRSSSNSSEKSLDSKQRTFLQSQWAISFRSLYQLVRTYQCPFFYMCAPTFTVMFRAGGVGSVLNVHAAITPTTRGLRNALKAEDIEFTMPFHPGFEHGDDDESTVLIEGDGGVTENDNIDIAESVAMEEEDEPVTWLESLGLSQQDFPSLNPSRSKLKKERKGVDHRPESLVYIEDSETQALVNFLLNYPSCTSKLGPMAGVPPTLLSPVAFLGSTLQAHKIQSNKVTTDGKDQFVVDVIGPLLPNAIHSLCSLFSTTQDGDFKAMLTSHAPTVAFTKLRSQNSMVPSAFATENLKDCGLPSPFIIQMCSNNASSIGGINTIIAKSNLFSWTSNL